MSKGWPTFSIPCFLFFQALIQACHAIFVFSILANPFLSLNNLNSCYRFFSTNQFFMSRFPFFIIITICFATKCYQIFFFFSFSKCPLRDVLGCDKEFSRPDKLKAHIIRHGGVKHHQCSYCSKIYSRKSFKVIDFSLCSGDRIRK